MRHPLAAATLLLAACVQTRPAPPAGNIPTPAPEAAPEAVPGPERVGYVILRGADTVSVERASRTRDLLSGDLLVRGQPNVEYQATLEPTQTVSRLILGVVPPGADPGAGVVQRSTSEFRGDTVIIERPQGDSTRTFRFATRAGAIPYVNPSMALAEQLLRRARVVGGEQVELPVLLTSGSVQTVTATVAFVGRDSARVAIAGAELRLATDATGRLLGGTIPSQGLRVERARDLPAEP